MYVAGGAQDTAPASPAAAAPGEARPDVATFGPAGAATAQQAQQGGLGSGAGEPASQRHPLGPKELESMLDEMGVPPVMRPRFLRLAALQPNLPIPMPTLVSPSRHLCQVRGLRFLLRQCWNGQHSAFPAQPLGAHGLQCSGWHHSKAGWRGRGAAPPVGRGCRGGRGGERQDAGGARPDARRPPG